MEASTILTSYSSARIRSSGSGTPRTTGCKTAARPGASASSSSSRGLQLNWSWAKTFPYTQFVPQLDPSQPSGVSFVPVEFEPEGSRMDFYIVYDF